MGWRKRLENELAALTSSLHSLDGLSQHLLHDVHIFRRTTNDQLVTAPAALATSCMRECGHMCECVCCGMTALLQYRGGKVFGIPACCNTRPFRLLIHESPSHAVPSILRKENETHSPTRKGCTAERNRQASEHLIAMVQACCAYISHHDRAACKLAFVHFLLDLMCTHASSLWQGKKGRATGKTCNDFSWSAMLDCRISSVATSDLAFST